MDVGGASNSNKHAEDHYATLATENVHLLGHTLEPTGLSFQISNRLYSETNETRKMVGTWMAGVTVRPKKNNSELKNPPRIVS